MPAPPSYIDITALPFTRVVTQAEFNGGTYGGVANEVWFRYVASGDLVFGMFVNEGGTFTPQSTLFYSDGSTSITGSNRTAWWALLDADTYYIRVRRLGSGSSDFDFTCNFDQGAFVTLPVVAGAIIINDDSTISGTDPFSGSPYPSTVWEPDGTFLGFTRDIVAGELGDALPNGISLWHNRFGSAGNFLKLYSSSFVLIATTDTTPALGGTDGAACFCNDGTQFFVLRRADNTVYTVSSSGTVTGPVATIVGGSINAMGVSRDGDTLYYAITNEKIIKRWQVSTDSALADFYTIPVSSADIAKTAVNGNPGEILVLSDDAVVTWYRDGTSGVYSVIHVSAAGASLHSHAVASGAVNHLHYHPSDPDKVNVWYFIGGSDSQGKFGTLDLATGTIDPSFEIALSSAGVSKVVGDPVIFQPSASCSMMTLNYGAEVITDEPDDDTGDDTVPCCADEPPGSGTDNDGKPKPPGLVPAGNPGAILPTVTPAWTITCVGLGTVPSAADLTDCESWTL